MKAQVNEIKIRYTNRIKSNHWYTIKCSLDAANLIYEHWNKDTIEIQETFKILLLNNANKVKGVFEMSKGGITGTMVDLRLLFAVVLKSLAVGVILTHNHPSETLQPSEADKRLTNKIKDAATLFDIKVLDHIIITPSGDYFSFADAGLV